MVLVPAEYPCPTHVIDLTDLVQGELRDPGFSMSFRKLPGRRASRPFEVQVTCPGSQPDGAHPLMFKGTLK